MQGPNRLPSRPATTTPSPTTSAAVPIARPTC